MKDFLSVKDTVETEYLVEKSRFICSVKRVNTIIEAKRFIEEVSKKYNDASHNTYAYSVLDNGVYQKYSDDGEPQGTAGIPILEVIKSKNLLNTCVVVTRYFGGIKLGAGGLLRAYTESCVLGIEKSKIVENVFSCKNRAIVEFSYVNKVLKVIENIGKKLDITYNDKGAEITYIVSKENEEILKNKLIDSTFGKCKIELINTEYCNF